MITIHIYIDIYIIHLCTIMTNKQGPNAYSTVDHSYNQRHEGLWECLCYHLIVK